MAPCQPASRARETERLTLKLREKLIARLLSVDLLLYHKEQALAAHCLFPDLTDSDFRLAVIIRCVRFALVFDNRQFPVGELRYEVRVKPTALQREPEGIAVL